MPIDEKKLKKLTKRDKGLIKLAQLGGSDIDLFFFDKINSLINSVEKNNTDFKNREEELKKKILDLNETFKLVKLKQGEPGKDGKSIKGDKGDTPTKKELKELIIPLIPKPINGKNGTTPVKGIDYFDGVDGKNGVGVNGADGSSDVPEVILKKIRSLENGLNIDDIDGLQELLDELEDKRLGSRVSGGGLNVGSWAIRTVDNEIIGTGDGSTTDFDVNIAPSPATSLHILVGTVELFLTDDWTLSGRTVSFIVSPPKKAKIRATYRLG